MDAAPAYKGPLPAAEVKGLAARSNARGLSQLGAHLALLAGTATLIWLSLGTWLLLPAMLLHGIFQVALFAPLHETVHRTAFASRGLNDAVASAIGLVHVLPANYFRRFHYAHHRFTQDPARDPELAAPKPATWGQYLLFVSGLRYWRDRLRELMRNARGRVDAPFIPPAERDLVKWEARAHLAVYAALLAAVPVFGTMAPLVFWLVPALLGQPFLRLYLLAEHTGCVESPDMLANTRTTISNAVVRFLMWNMPYHTEHHCYPAVPFHRLSALNVRMARHLKVTAPGYAAFHRDYRNALARGAGEAFIHPSLPV